MKRVKLAFIGLLTVAIYSCKKGEAITEAAGPKSTLVSTFAGNGIAGFQDGPSGYNVFNGPQSIAMDASGNLFVADYRNARIRKITPDGNVTTYAGSGKAGYVDGPAVTAQFNLPRGIAVDAAGNVYVSDNDYILRKISTDGQVSTLAGSSPGGFADGQGTTARFSYLADLAIDASGNIIAADQFGNRIRKITPGGLVSTIAGTGTISNIDGPVASATFDTPTGVTVDLAGNIFVAQSGASINNIRKITPAGVVSTVAGSPLGGSGYLDGVAATAKFNTPKGLSSDAAGNVYIAEFQTQKIRKLSPEGLVTTVAGSDLGFADGIPSASKFNAPYDIVSDASGTNLYIAEFTGQRIRKISTTSTPIPLTQTQQDQANWNKPTNWK